MILANYVCWNIKFTVVFSHVINAQTFIRQLLFTRVKFHSHLMFIQTDVEELDLYFESLSKNASSMIPDCVPKARWPFLDHRATNLLLAAIITEIKMVARKWNNVTWSVNIAPRAHVEWHWRIALMTLKDSTDDAEGSYWWHWRIALMTLKDSTDGIEG